MKTHRKIVSFRVIAIVLCSAFFFFGTNSVQAGYVYNSQFGGFGAGNGQFYAPTGIAISPTTGDIYVADTGNNRVQIFNSSGMYQSQFGTTGSGNGQFNHVFDLAIDSLGNIYTNEENNNRIQKFNSSGVYQSQFGSSGSGSGQWLGSHGIAIDSADNIYVGDTVGHRIQKFNSSGVYQSQFGSSGSGNGQFGTLEDITIDSQDNIYVTDGFNNYRVQKFNSSGVYQSQFGSLGSGNGQFSQPFGIAVSTSTGNIHVADFGNNRIETFNSSGMYQSQFVSAARHIAFDQSGNMYITTNNNTVEKFIATFYPVVSTLAATSITTNSAVLNGLISDVSNDDATQHGFVWGTSSTLSGGDTATTTLGSFIGTGNFSQSISGLKKNKTYYFRAYATNSSGTGYGEIVAFTTCRNSQCN